MEKLIHEKADVWLTLPTLWIPLYLFLIFSKIEWSENESALWSYVLVALLSISFFTSSAFLYLYLRQKLSALLFPFLIINVVNVLLCLLYAWLLVSITIWGS
jgi:hypothetical protein